MEDTSTETVTSHPVFMLSRRFDIIRLKTMQHIILNLTCLNTNKS